MFIEAGRDMAAMFALDECLSRVREEYIELVLAGNDPGDNFWTERETMIVNEIKHRFFDNPIEKADQSDSPAPGSADPSPTEPDPGDPDDNTHGLSDVGQHSQKLLEYAIWMTHEITKHIPYLGQEEYVKS